MKELAFAAKKVISLLLYPLGMCLVLLFAGLVLLRGKRNGRLGYWLVTVAALLLLITSLPITGFFLMRPLENMAGPSANPEDLRMLGVHNILVLGGGGVADWRIVEGIRLLRHLPESRLILSGGRNERDNPAWKLPEQMGVAQTSLTLRSGAYDTADEARAFTETVGKEPFALVTSAYHMPRAMRLFRAMGLNPIAAPCEHRTREFPAWPACLLPNADALLSSQLALHEYMGMGWQIINQETRNILR